MKRPVSSLLVAAPLVGAALFGACGVAAQDAPGTATPPAPAERSREAPPSLDELLGITKDEADEVREPGVDIIKRLTGGEPEAGAGVNIAALFVEAVDSMDKSAVLLLDQRSAGLATQRFQEAALLKLDTLIAQAQQQGKPKPSSQSQPGDQQSPPQPQHQQPQTNAPGSDASRGGDNRPGLKQTKLDGAIDETRSEWGNLPPRVRELLRQGRGDAAARLYQRLTEIYYQRLAEESQP